VVERIRAPEGCDPAHVVELRERAELAHRARRGRRRRADEQITRALALIVDGYSIKQAAFTAGVSRERVARWLARSGLPRPRPRKHMPEQIRTALALVEAGASRRAAAAAVGASKSGIQHWLKTMA
jgi:transposase